jgi:hypothetical protein
LIRCAGYIATAALQHRGKLGLTDDLAKKIIRGYVQSLLDADLFEAAAILLWGPGAFDWRPESCRRVWEGLMGTDKLLVQGAGSMGKCLALGTPVIMADGSVQAIETVRVGDEVMGPDSKPRRVVETHFGISPMYRVQQDRGDAYTVTDDHILTLVCCADKLNGDGKTVSSSYTRGRVIDMSVQDYLASSEQFRKYYKGLFTGVQFPAQSVPVDPYVFGLWLGDGSATGDALNLTTQNEPIARERTSYWEGQGYTVRVATKAGNRASTYIVRKHTLKAIMGFALDGGKQVPECYKLNSKEVRAQVLAGFIDTDGYVAGSGYGFTQKSKAVTDGIVFIARSLGLTATVAQCRKQCVNNGAWGDYYRVHISGDCTVIPSRIKPATKRGRRPCLGQKLTIKPAGKQAYYGFTLDGDHRFLLGDFTVTHNSYGAAAWFYLDWYRDPDWTCIKVVSLTAAHATRNIFASIKTFHRTALVRLGGPENDLATSIQSTTDSKQGIHLVAIPKGESGHGSLRGFHPSPRFGPAHPRWGKISRTHIVLDEAEEVPDGVWAGVMNCLTAADSSTPGRIKVFAASNPRDRTSQFGQRCEPKFGWGSIEMEQDRDWVSRDGWQVIRLDAADCENVLKRRLVYHGLQTYEGFMAYVSKGRTAEAATMARGWFPDEGIAMSIITPAMMDNAMGVVRFIGPVVPLAAFDLALEGVDQVLCSYGRFGLSDGWTDRSGKFHEFKRPRTMLQLDSQMPFPKAATLEQAHAIVRFCKQMKISPRWLCVDRTGNGAGIHDLLCSLFGSEVMGLNYSWAATETPVMGDDSQKANELYNGLVTELLFALGKYLEFEWLKISPGFRNEELTKQAISRRYIQKGKGLVRVESKKDYIKRTRLGSPDALDSLSMMVHLMRQRGGNVATMSEKKPEPIEKGLVSLVDSTDSFVDFSD